MSSKNRGGRKRDNNKKQSSGSPSKNKSKNKKKYDESSLWSKASPFGSDLSEDDWDRQDIIEIIYWFRQFLSILIGILWGMVRLEGLIGILLYFVVSVFTLHSYKNLLKVSDELFDIIDAFKEGFIPGFGLFMIAWIASYSLTHYP